MCTIVQQHSSTAGQKVKIAETVRYELTSPPDIRFSFFVFRCSSEFLCRSGHHAEFGLFFYSDRSFGNSFLDFISRACHGPTLVRRPGPSTLDMIGRGPTRPIKSQLGGPRPGSARQILREWAAPRPSPSKLNKIMARPGPAH